MRQHYGIALEEQAPGGEGPCELEDDLEQVGMLEEVGIGLQRWAQLRGVPMEYLNQEKKENQKGPEQ